MGYRSNGSYSDNITVQHQAVCFIAVLLYLRVSEVRGVLSVNELELKEAPLMDHICMLWTALGADTFRLMASPWSPLDCVSSNSTSSGTPRSVRSKLEMYLSLTAAVSSVGTNVTKEPS